MAAGYLIVLLTVFHQVWWGGRGGVRVFGWDCLREYWPDLAFQIRSLARGHAPSWNPYSLGGHPFYGDPQTGLFFPVNWLFWLLSWLSGSVGPWLIVAKVLLLLELGLVGMHLLVLRRTGSHLAGAAAAIIFVLGSPSLVHKNSSLLWPILLLPWVILALDRFIERPTWRRGALLAAALWLCGSAGSAQGFFYALLVIGPYWVYRILAVPRDAGHRRRQLPGAALALVTSLLLLGAT